MPRRRVLHFARPLTQATGAGKSSSDADATIQLPKRGMLKTIHVHSPGTNQAPVFVSIIAGSSLVTGFTMNGWVRGNGYGHGDSLSGRPDFPLKDEEDNNIFVGFRNDTGSDATIRVAWVVELSA